MIDQAFVEAAAKFVEYIATPETAFGIWIAATGVILGAYLMEPFLHLL